MKSRLQTCWLASIIIVAFAGPGSDARGDDCRPTQERVVFEAPAAYRAQPDDAEVVEVFTGAGLAGGRIRLTIRRLQLRLGAYLDPRLFVLASDDLGQSWEGIPDEGFTPLITPGVRLVKATSDSKHLYRYLSELGLYLRSKDGGETWALPQYNVEGESSGRFASEVAGRRGYIVSAHMMALDPHDPLRLFATLWVVPWTALFHPTNLPSHLVPGTFVSSDGGENWAKFTDALLADNPMGIHPANSHVFWGRGREGIVRSNDGGKHWYLAGDQTEMLSHPVVREPGSPGGTAVLESRGLEVIQFVPDPNDREAVFVVTNKGVYRTLDGGNSWVRLRIGAPELDGIHNLALTPSNASQVVVGTTHGILYSDDRGCHFRQIYPQVD